MPSSYTTRNRLEKQAAGENSNTWGTRLNANVIDLADFAADGMTSFALSTTKVLTTADGSADEARARYLNITSGSGGTVTIPNLEKNYLVRNATSGDVIFTTGSGTTATVKSGNLQWIVCEGGNVVRAVAVTNFGSSNLVTTGTFGAAAATFTGALTYGGVTLSNSVTGTGSMVLSADPTLTGTLTASTGVFTGSISSTTRIEAGATMRSTGSANFSSGAGTELLYSSGVGFLQPFDRTGAVWLPLAIRATEITLRASSSGTPATIATVNTTGINLDSGKTLLVNGTQVLTARRTGWTAASGTASRATYATSTVTTEQLAQRVKALIDDLITHGLIGT